MSPLPNAQGIPDSWEKHHRPVAEATMTAHGKITRSNGPAPYPKQPGWADRADLVTDCRFRVQEIKRENAPAAAGQPMQERRYLITMPIGKVPADGFHAGEQGDLVEVLGQSFRIIQPLKGSLLWEMDLMCTDNITQNGP